MEKKKFVDLREVIKSKNPKLYRWLPNFVLKYIEKIGHEDDINTVMWNIGHLSGHEFVDALINQEMNIKVNLVGEENIPEGEKIIYASNHPLGGIDGIAAMYALGRKQKGIKFFMNDVMMNIKPLNPFSIPVNKHGIQAKEAMKLLAEAYSSVDPIFIFPAGLVSRKNDQGQIRDLEWKKSFINKAKKYKRIIIPVYIDGKNSEFFYNLAKFRKVLGIKANIEMFYLADEMFGQKNKNVNITIGKPIPYERFDTSKTEQQWAEEVKNEVYALA